jgi:hypothetical protein
MCRNIKMLFNFDPPVTDEEIRAAFLAAVDKIPAVSARLLSSLETNAPKRSREEEAAKAKARNAERFRNEGRVA